MTNSIDIVMQGPVNPYSFQIAEYYLTARFVENVVISTWEGSNIPEKLNPRIKIVLNKDVLNPGVGNRNRQIYSSSEGLKRVSTEFCLKCRTDQRIYLDSLLLMRAFYEKNKEGEFGNNQICSASIFPSFPFHPCDHIFWGDAVDLSELFNVPLDPDPQEEPDYATRHTRAETYIGASYCAKFDQRVFEFIQSPKKYLTDAAPNRDEAIKVSDELTRKVFKPFPRIHFDWPKHYNHDYFYFTNPYGEEFS